VRDLPVLVCRTHGAIDAVQHVPLAGPEARDIQRLVSPLREGRRRVVFVVGQLLQTQQFRDCSSTLWPGAGIYGCLTVIVEGDLLVLEVKAVPLWSQS
jgi:hypothetical protein